MKIDGTMSATVTRRHWTLHLQRLVGCRGLHLQKIGQKDRRHFRGLQCVLGSFSTRFVYTYIHNIYWHLQHHSYQLRLHLEDNHINTSVCWVGQQHC